jgi:hypothetical protein
MEKSPDKGNADTFSSCNSSHTGSRIFFQFSQYENFSKILLFQQGLVSELMLTEIFAHLSKYCTHLKTVNLFNAVYGRGRIA